MRIVQHMKLVHTSECQTLICSFSALITPVRGYQCHIKHNYYLGLCYDSFEALNRARLKGGGFVNIVLLLSIPYLDLNLCHA